MTGLRPARTTPIDPAAHTLGHDSFDRVAVAAPWIEVDTTDGYDPGLKAIVDLVNARR
ncbi:hypothetical protein ACIBBB_18180 [Streptomyces sp. NPDC051217]|uniref:hypothetical protein n=1 Tax=Streptomyces sp. NPDC051217 TaxID=3365644 RepID=UPI0037B03229